MSHVTVWLFLKEGRLWYVPGLGVHRNYFKEWSSIDVPIYAVEGSLCFSYQFWYLRAGISIGSCQRISHTKIIFVYIAHIINCIIFTSIWLPLVKGLLTRTVKLPYGCVACFGKEMWAEVSREASRWMLWNRFVWIAMSQERGDNDRSRAPSWPTENTECGQEVNIFAVSSGIWELLQQHSLYLPGSCPGAYMSHFLN